MRNETQVRRLDTNRVEPLSRTAILVALSPLADDPRVRRMGDYLHSKGWRVIGFGLPGAKSPPPEWPIHCDTVGSPDAHAIFDGRIPPTPDAELMAEIPQRPRIREVLEKAVRAPHKLTGLDIAVVWAFLVGFVRLAFNLILRPPLRFARRLIGGVVKLGLWVGGMAAGGLVWLLALPVAVANHQAGSMLRRGAKVIANPRVGFSRFMNYFELYRRVRRKGEAADQEILRQSEALRAIEAAALEHGEAGLWVANDWLVMPIVSRAVEKFGGASAYDSHEFATEEYVERLDWRIFQQPLVRTIERRHIARAAVVTSVSPGITEALKSRYALKVPTATLRNLPRFEAHAYRPVGQRVRFLYHGVVAQGRGLMETIESVSAWSPDTELVIRGPGSMEYIASLKAKVEACGVGGRVTIEPPIPTTELVRGASAFDVGMMALPGHSDHNQFALPNKIFEYTMAGLALCVSDLPAMADVVRQFGTGVLISDTTPEAIAEAVNRMDRSTINVMKQRSIEAAKQLHFDNDAQRVAELYEKAFDDSRVPVSARALAH